MQAPPRTSFEVIEAEFLFELLVRLLANPTRLDCCGKRLEIDFRGQIGEIIFSFARVAPFAYEPSFLARHMLLAFVADTLRPPVSDAHANGGESGFERPLRSFPPAQAAPLRRFQHVFGGKGELVGNMTLARSPASGDREDEPNIARIHFLMSGDSYRPCQAAGVEALADGRREAIAGVGEHDAKAHVGGKDA